MTTKAEAKEFNWNVKRFCFHCQLVASFLFCDNCGHRFCTNYAEIETEYDPILGTFS